MGASSAGTGDEVKSLPVEKSRRRKRSLKKRKEKKKGGLWWLAKGAFSSANLWQLFPKPEENKQPKSFLGVAALTSVGVTPWLSFNPCLEQVQSLIMKTENQPLSWSTWTVTFFYVSLPFQLKTF